MGCCFFFFALCGKRFAEGGAWGCPAVWSWPNSPKNAPLFDTTAAGCTILTRPERNTAESVAVFLAEMKAWSLVMERHNEVLGCSPCVRWFHLFLGLELELFTGIQTLQTASLKFTPSFFWQVSPQSSNSCPNNLISPAFISCAIFPNTLFFSFTS